jgi:hypothetical protein
VIAWPLGEPGQKPLSGAVGGFAVRPTTAWVRVGQLLLLRLHQGKEHYRVSSFHSSSALRLLAAACCCAVFVTGGCNQGPALTPVSGTITGADGKPLSVGSVTFIPDKDKGNKAAVSPVGQVDATGKYEMFTNGKKGAPVGAYKVTITANVPGQMGGAPAVKNPGDVKPGESPMPLPDPNATASKVDPKFANADTTTIRIEVVAGAQPGTYDIKLGK